MDPANSAAVASTPSVKGGITLDSFDARIVEYQCAIRKFESLTTHVKAVNIKMRSQEDLIPLIHYIVALAGPWVAGANDVLKRRLDQVSRLQLVSSDARRIPAVTTMAISFEVDEQNEIRAPDYLSTDIEYSLLLDSLLAIFTNSLSIYQAKLKQCMLERDAHRRPDANHKPIPLDISTFNDILEPIEVTTLSKFVIPKSDLSNSHFKSTPFLLEAINKTIQNIYKYHTELLGYKKKASDAILKRLPAWTNTNHRIFACFVKLGDLYHILRKLGRDIYLPMSEELHSPKLLHNNVKLEIALKNCDEFLKSSRRNEQILFALTRVTRQGSYYHIKRDTILSFIPALEQSILLNQKLVDVISELLKNWELAHAKEKRTAKLKLETQMAKEKADTVICDSAATVAASSTPESKRLSILFNPDREKRSQEVIAKQQREMERVILEERTERERVEKERQTVEDIKSKRRIEERERQLRDELIKDRSPTVSRNGSLITSRPRSSSNASNSSASKFSPAPPPLVTRQRSGSNASTTSNSSNSSVLNSMRNNSLTNGPVQRSPTSLSRSPSVQVRRPVSVFMSSPAFDIRSELRRQDKAKQSAAAAASASAAMSPPNMNSFLKRTPSLPSGRTRVNPQITATAGAASAVKQDRQIKDKRTSSLKTQAELQHQRQYASQQSLGVISDKRNGGSRGTSPSRRSPSPSKHRSLDPSQQEQQAQQHNDLPDISELSIQSTTSVSPPPRSSLSKVSTPEITSTVVKDFEITPKINTIIEEGPMDDSQSDIQDTPSKSPSPVLKSSLKSPTKTLDPSSSPSQQAPELSHTTETTSTESSISFNEHLEDEAADCDSPPLITSKQTPETLTPTKTVKKVRFTGVPDEIEEDRKPKRKGWIHPPKILARSNKAPTSLSYAAQALVQQERVTFSNIKRGQFDMKTGKVIYPEQKGARIMSTLVGNDGGGSQSNSPKGKWRIGGKLKDRFS